LLQVAFVNVSSAEKAGVNATNYLATLNDAGSDLTLAEVSLSNGNYSEAVNQVVACKELADSVSSDAATRPCFACIFLI